MPFQLEERIVKTTPNSVSSTLPLLYLTKTEFMEWYWKTLNDDSKKQNSSILSRTFTDSEAIIFKEHLWEYIKNNFTLDEEKLALALIKYKGKYDSEQEKAKAIIKYLGFENI